jgi:hypothetical protein
MINLFSSAEMKLRLTWFFTQWRIVMKDFLFGLVTGIMLSLCAYLGWETYRYVPVLIRPIVAPRTAPFRPPTRRDLSTKFTRLADYHYGPESEGSR